MITQEIMVICAVLVACTTSESSAANTNRVYANWPQQDPGYDYSKTTTYKWPFAPFPSNTTWKPAQYCFDKYIKDAEDVTYHFTVYEEIPNFQSLPPPILDYVKVRLKLKDKTRGVAWVQECMLYVSYKLTDSPFLSVDVAAGKAIFIDRPFTWIWDQGPLGTIVSKPAVVPRNFCGRICTDTQGGDGEGPHFVSSSRTCHYQPYPTCRSWAPIVYPIVNLLIEEGKVSVFGGRLVLTSNDKNVFYTHPEVLEKSQVHGSINGTVLALLNETLSGVPTGNSTDLNPLRVSINKVVSQFVGTTQDIQILTFAVHELRSTVKTLKIVLGIMSTILGVFAAVCIAVFLCFPGGSRSSPIPGKGLSDA